jgi:hypothetical protein
LQKLGEAIDREAIAKTGGTAWIKVPALFAKGGEKFLRGVVFFAHYLGSSKQPSRCFVKGGRTFFKERL